MSARPTRLLLAATALALATAHRAAAQNYFGQNQVQYHQFNWQVIETEHFLVHYYPAEREAALDVARMAERAYARLSRILAWEFREKKPILLFASRADFGENTVTGDLGEGTGGVTEPYHNRMLFFFTGDYRTTEHVLTHEMVHEFQFDVFARGHAGSGIQSLERVNPPLWYMEGMAEYLSKGPDDPHTNVIIRDAALNNNLPTIAQLTNEPNKFFPYRYGESFFAYVGRRWGDEAIGAILLQTPYLGVERAFEKETGKSLAQTATDWKVAMQDKWLPLAATLARASSVSEPLLTKHRTGGDVFVDPALSPDGRYIVFLSNGNPLKGQVFIDLWLADAQTGKRITRLIESTIDPNYEEIGLLYSQVAFSPDGSKLAFSALSGGQEVLHIFDVERRKRIATIRPRVDGLTGPAWSPDGKRIVFSGSRGGISDLYVTDVDGGNLVQLTHDRAGDLQPQWSPDGNTIAFATERGPGINVADLIFPKLRIGLYHLDTREIELLPNQAGQNINPNWAPDGRAIAYVSNRSGIPEIYLYDLTSRAQYQITNFVGGVSGITDVSPALSWAHAADRLAFVYFEKDVYTIWTLDDPRRLAREPIPDAAQVAAATAAADSARLKPPPAFGVPSSAYYNGVGGFRPAASPPRPAEATGEPIITVGATLDTGAVALPDTSAFLYYPYKLKLFPEIASSAVVGYSQNNFGSGFYGGAAVLLSDMIGSTEMLFSGAVNGRLEDFQLFASYTFLGSRIQYSFGILNQPFYYARGIFYGNDPYVANVTDIVSATTRYLERGVFAVGMYPLNRFTRFELGTQFTSLNQQDLAYIIPCDSTIFINNGGYCAQVAGAYQKRLDQSTKNYVQPHIAWVTDDTFFGYFAPIFGRRYRLEVQPTFGDYRFMSYLGDLRRYDPIIFNKLIFASHFQGVYTTGRNANALTNYIAYPYAVRGYNGNEFVVSCTSLCNPALGSSVMWVNFELRAPIYRGGAGSLVPVPPIELFAFYDAGIAWFQGQSITLARKGAFDPVNTRTPLTSNGFGARINLFGAAILSWAFVMPHDTPDHHPYWQFSLYPPF